MGTQRCVGGDYWARVAFHVYIAFNKKCYTLVTLTVFITADKGGDVRIRQALLIFVGNVFHLASGITLAPNYKESTNIISFLKLKKQDERLAISYTLYFALFGVYTPVEGKMKENAVCL